MILDEQWMRSRLLEEFRNESLDCFAEEYLDGLTVMARGERGGPDQVVYKAKDEEDLRFVEISDSREHDDHGNVVEEPRPGSVIRIID